MQQLSEGDQVRIDIPDETDPDHKQYHGKHGTIISLLFDDVTKVTGKDVDTRLYRIETESGETMDFRGRDLRPPIE
jgi:ribosomal protein L21E